VYTFTEHDGREAGVQVIKDKDNNVELTISFLKVPAQEAGKPRECSKRIHWN
jgi:mannosyl-oligosaccharide glucosidase